MLSGGLAANRVMEMRRRNFLDHDFTPGFRIDLHHKDLGIALETAASTACRCAYRPREPDASRAARQGPRGRRPLGLLTLLEELAEHPIGDGRQTATTTPEGDRCRIPSMNPMDAVVT